MNGTQLSREAAEELYAAVNETYDRACGLIAAKCEDVVNHPSHYQSKSGLETIQVIEAFTADLVGIEAVCTANALKYLCRWKHKNGLQDLEKAKWYLEYLINHIKNNEKGSE